MKKLLFILFISPSISFAVNVPEFTHKDPIVQQEFENVGFEIKKARNAGGTSISSSTLPSGSTQYIQNTIVPQTGATASPQYINAGSSITAPIVVVSSVNTQTGSVAIVVNNSGEILQPLQPSFLATAPSNTQNVTGDGTAFTLEYDTEIADRGGDYNTATYTFTASVTGLYSFSAGLQWAGASVVSFGSISFITSNRTYRKGWGTRSTVDSEILVAVQVDMDAGDTCYVEWTSSGGTKTAEQTDDATYNFFSGTLIN